VAEITWPLEETIHALHSRRISERGGSPGIRDLSDLTPVGG
jgi:hypothetical protein